MTNNNNNKVISVTRKPESEGLFYLQYSFKKMLTYPYPDTINEYFTDMDALRKRKVEIANSFFDANVNFIAEGTAIIENGVIMPDNRVMTLLI